MTGPRILSFDMHPARTALPAQLVPATP
ncbi:MAG: hypothetical protein RLZZ563_569, partial [Pseudomonadota bacterium]